MQQNPLHKGISILRTIIMALLILLLVLAVTAVFSQENSSIITKLKYYKEDGIYGPKDSRVGYFIQLRNTVNDNQKGTIAFDVKNEMGQSIHHEDVSLFIKPRGAFGKELNVDVAKLQAGFYQATITINTNYHTESSNYVFGIEPEKIKPHAISPPDFIGFWENAKNELANINPQYRITRRGDVSTLSHDVFLVEFQSIQNHTIRGWLSVPKGNRKYPVLYRLPDYMANAYIETINHTACFSIDIRNTGNSSDNGKIGFDNYLITGLNNQNEYIYRGAIMDCLRGVDFIYNHSSLKLDTSKIIIRGVGQGASLAAATAALNNKVKGIVMERPTLVDLRTRFALGEIQNEIPWPIVAIKNYCNATKMGLDNFFKVWDYFDALSFATLVKCPVLMGAALKGKTSPPQCTYHFYNQLLVSQREMYSSADTDNNMNKGYAIFENNWIREVLRIP
ncbi:MAG: acetylxylan esterase [Chitinophagaceae bacterium]